MPEGNNNLSHSPSSGRLPTTGGLRNAPGAPVKTQGTAVPSRIVPARCLFPLLDTTIAVQNNERNVNGF